MPFRDARNQALITQARQNCSIWYLQGLPMLTSLYSHAQHQLIDSGRIHKTSIVPCRILKTMMNRMPNPPVHHLQQGCRKQAFRNALAFSELARYFNLSGKAAERGVALHGCLKAATQHSSRLIAQTYTGQVSPHQDRGSPPSESLLACPRRTKLRLNWSLQLLCTADMGNISCEF